MSARSTARREPLRIYNALMAGWLVLIGGAAFTDLIGGKAAALLVLLTAATQTGVGEWVRGKVTPIADPQDRDGTPLVRAEPATDVTRPPEG